jgi:PleD family two-component response regulator
MPFPLLCKKQVASCAELPKRILPKDDLPLSSSATMPQDQSLYPSVASSEGTILIVDDDASVRHALHLTLRTLGFRISGVSGGEEALALARAFAYDGVLLDMNMTGMDGLETCRQLRRLLPHIAIVMPSVRDGEEDKVNAFEPGAGDYVTKPLHIRELTARIRAGVRRSQALEGNAKAPIRISDIELDPVRRCLRAIGGTRLRRRGGISPHFHSPVRQEDRGRSERS